VDCDRRQRVSIAGAVAFSHRQKNRFTRLNCAKVLHQRKCVITLDKPVGNLTKHVDSQYFNKYQSDRRPKYEQAYCRFDAVAKFLGKRPQDDA